jgi:GNAT superfamily N-acetyltransferase
MQVEVAELRDIRSWLDLAAEVEALFGNMLDNHGFYDALLRTSIADPAYCVRERDGPPGAPLMGGMLFSPRRPNRPKYRIGWLAVAERWRRRGVGRRLVEHAFRQVRRPATISVVTFGDDVDSGKPARLLYERIGFSPAELAPIGPKRGSRQVYRLELVAPPSPASTAGG